MKVNEIIRREARAAGVPLWKVAKRLGISEPTMTRRLREELSEDDRKKVLSIIAELAEEGY